MATLHVKWVHMSYKFTDSILSFGRVCSHFSERIWAILRRKWAVASYPVYLKSKWIFVWWNGRTTITIAIIQSEWKKINDGVVTAANRWRSEKYTIVWCNRESLNPCLYTSYSSERNLIFSWIVRVYKVIAVWLEPPGHPFWQNFGFGREDVVAERPAEGVHTLERKQRRR